MGNTGAWHFLSAATENACKDEKTAIDKACDVSKHDQKRFVNQQKGRNRRRNRNRGKSDHALRPKTWKDNHCKHLLFQPRPDLLQERLKKFEADAKDMYHDLAGEAWDVAKDRAAEQAKNTGQRMVTKWVAGLGCTVFTPAGTAACEAAITVWNVLDGVYSVIAGGVRMARAAMDVKEMANILSSVPEQLKKVEASINDENKRKKLRKELINEAMQAATRDPCIKARKCMLVPYKGDTYKNEEHLQTVKVGKHTLKEIPKYKGSTFMTKIGMATSSGCCPGQTGHHVIPDSWAKKANCPGYSKRQAPVVCVEGVSDKDGTHGKIHKNLNKILRHKKSISSTYKETSEVIEMAAQSHAETFNNCSQKCIEKQLEAYYRNCKNFNPKPINPKRSAKSGSTMQKPATRLVQKQVINAV
ncbi:MAG: HNH/endonuclease VII fold toxin-2 domain-containing protein [Pseudomonadota bacterium]